MSKKSASVRINLSYETYGGPRLPQTWQVIYQEGLRGNHLLFSESDLQAMDKLSPKAIDSELEASVIENAVRMVKCSSLGELRSHIKGLNQSQKVVVFRLYQRFLSHWTTYAKAHMN